MSNKNKQIQQFVDDSDLDESQLMSELIGRFGKPAVNKWSESLLLLGTAKITTSEKTAKQDGYDAIMRESRIRPD